MPSPATTPQRTVSEFTGRDAVQEFLSTIYSNTRLVRGDDHPALRHQRVDAGAFALDDAHFLATFDYQSTPLNAIVVSWARTAYGQRASGDVHQGYVAGDVFLSGYPDLPFSGHFSPGEFRTAVLDHSLIDQIAAAAPARRPGRPRITGLTPISRTAATHWCTTRSYVADLLDTPYAAGAPLVISSAGRLLAAATLTAFPNTALTDPTIEDRHDASPLALRKAIAFISAHPAEDMCVADIAAAAHISVRALQLAFRRHLDTTPMAYLRQTRLDHAHQDLLAADPTRTTVTAIAARWGFLTLSRFSALYRQKYRQLPSTSLHN